MTDQLPDERPTRRREYSGATSTLGIAALIVVVVGLGLWFFQFRDSGGGGRPGSGGIIALPTALNATGRAPAAEQGRAAPDFRLQQLPSGTLTLDSLHGRYVLLNFWASWCAPCRAETPRLEEFYEKAKAAGKPVTIVGINQQETASAASTFVSQFGVRYPIVLDISGEVSQAYHVDRGLPQSFLINPNGVIDHIYLGEISDSDFAALEKELLS